MDFQQVTYLNHLYKIELLADKGNPRLVEAEIRQIQVQDVVINLVFEQVECVGFLFTDLTYNGAVYRLGYIR